MATVAHPRLDSAEYLALQAAAGWRSAVELIGGEAVVTPPLGGHIREAEPGEQSPQPGLPPWLAVQPRSWIMAKPSTLAALLVHLWVLDRRHPVDAAEAPRLQKHGLNGRLKLLPSDDRAVCVGRAN